MNCLVFAVSSQQAERLRDTDDEEDAIIDHGRTEIVGDPPQRPIRG